MCMPHQDRALHIQVYAPASSTYVLYFCVSDRLPVAMESSMGHIEITEIEARSILTMTRGFTSVDVPGTGFDYSLNPYRGCAFNCTYCYAPAFVFDAAARENWGRWSQSRPMPSRCCGVPVGAGSWMEKMSTCPR